MSAAYSPGEDVKNAVFVLDTTGFGKENLVHDLLDRTNAPLELIGKLKCPIMANESAEFGTSNLPKVNSPLELNSHVTAKKRGTLKLMSEGGGGENVPSSAIDNVDGLGKYKLTDQQRTELTSIFQKTGQPSPSVVLDVASQLGLSPVAAEKFFRSAKRKRRSSRAGPTDAESIAMRGYNRPVENVGPDSLEGSSNRMASLTAPLDGDSTGQNLLSVGNRWDALKRRGAEVPPRPLPEVETIRRETKNKCSALSDGIKEGCGCCHDICICTCLLCCLFCCCCCIFCYNAAAPNRPIVF